MLKNLKQLRTERGISQKTLGEQIGVSQQSVNKYENNHVEPDIHTLIALADYFKTSVDYLIGHTSIRHMMEYTTKYDLNDEEGDLIEQYRRLDNDEQKSIQLVMNNYNKNRG